MQKLTRRLAGAAWLMFLFSSGCVQFWSFEAHKVDRTFYAYDTDGPAQFSEYSITTQSPWRTSRVLVQECDSRSGEFNGGGAVPCWRAGSEPVGDNLRQWIERAPSYRDPNLFEIAYPYLNPELGNDPAFVVGLHPLAIAFVNMSPEQFVFDYEVTREIWPMKELLEQRLPYWEAVRSGPRLLALPTDHSLDHHASKLVVYPMQMEFDEQDRLASRNEMVKQHFMARVYVFDNTPTLRQLLPVINDPNVLQRISRTNSVIPVTGIER